ncbi:endolytic transglycosylase MltG [Marinomonas sp. M1K-6]|uniref:Endolytic murein transglycosylase n=1 Tax=Marinomonas profundi TaxID=2726122 RepID=A0A847R3B7_9GAMM|nr:endolytic transglycosylase MltG [Marinomonas profundi]NLQ16436.1 endolytic transglycosylase MltG [Marinomonas profundi]UDV02991.1 endolytic transglycosylase MltG [Marinomonas profundi]
MAYIKWLYRVTFLCVTLMAVLAGYLYYSITSPIPLNSMEVFEVRTGDTSHSLGAELNKKGWIEYPFLTRVVARLHPEWVPKVGKYSVQPEMNLLDVMALFDSGQSIFYAITLLEGKTTQDFLSAMAARGNITMTLTGLSNEDIAQQLGLDVSHPEGQFFANTYRYHDGDTDASILKHAHGLMAQTLASLWENKAPNLPYKSPYDALIMASIIEKETGVPEERPLIARVFISRLEKGMRLQTDPTVIYGLGDGFKGNLTRKGLQDLSPYNTYRVAGLPPTPIANVGREAMAAALNPGETKALYFVAKGDGSHAFSNSLKEHNRAVREYQFKRRADYRSTPEATK